jgi:hypothetical protein
MLRPVSTRSAAAVTISSTSRLSSTRPSMRVSAVMLCFKRPPHHGVLFDAAHRGVCRPRDSIARLDDSYRLHVFLGRRTGGAEIDTA